MHKPSASGQWHPRLTASGLLTLCMLLLTATWAGPSLSGSEHLSAELPASESSLSEPSRQQRPQPFTATYKASYNGINVTAIRTLKAIDGQTQELRFSASAWLASIDESSRFQWNDEGQIVPHHYLYQRSVLGRERRAELDFDWQQHVVVNDVQNKPWQMKVPPATLDKLSYQLQLRHDVINGKPQMRYQIADGGHLKVYEFERLGDEVIDTPVGRLATTKIKRVRDDNQRVTYLWLAKDWDHLLVRLQQEEDGEQYEINLASAELGGTPVTGQ